MSAERVNDKAERLKLLLDTMLRGPKRPEVEDSGGVLTLPEVVSDLEAKSYVDAVGRVGGVRLYIPARMANDSQFPFPVGDAITVTVLKSNGKSVGLLVAKRKFVDLFEKQMAVASLGLSVLLSPASK